ncbi:MAG: hypothetical protein IKS20_09380 [Victivallales bacterium]|nr:hypothetical protein [Victivallales bacterium]
MKHFLVAFSLICFNFAFSFHFNNLDRPVLRNQDPYCKIISKDETENNLIKGMLLNVYFPDTHKEGFVYIQFASPRMTCPRFLACHWFEDPALGNKNLKNLFPIKTSCSFPYMWPIGTYIAPNGKKYKKMIAFENVNEAKEWCRRRMNFQKKVYACKQCKGTGYLENDGNEGKTKCGRCKGTGEVIYKETKIPPIIKEIMYCIEHVH